MAWIVLDGLPLIFTTADLARLCAPFGTVLRAQVVTMPDGTSLGYGRVEMASDAEADAACRALDGRLVANHLLSVRRVQGEPPSNDSLE